MNRHSHSRVRGLSEDAKSVTIALPTGDAILRRFAVFLDGMARALILPFGPLLIHRILSGQKPLESSWQSVAYYLSLVVSVFVFGHWFGTFMSQRIRCSSQGLPRYVARLGGIVLSLHVFAFGAGINSIRWLVFVRFLTAVLVGLLSGLTRDIILPEDVIASSKKALLEFTPGQSKKAARQVDIPSGTAKIYLGGFAVSVLSGGLLFQTISADSTLQTLTGAYQFSWSPLFFLGLSLGLELILRRLFVSSERLSAKCSSKVTWSQPVPRAVFGSHTGRESAVPFDEELASSIHASDDDSAYFLDPYNSTSSANNSVVSRHRGRSRVESYTSVDEFFDCHSAFSDMDDLSFDGGAAPPDSTAVATYVDNRCVYDDGTPAYVPVGDCSGTIPSCYVDAFGSQARAEAAWEKTQRWRYEEGVWEIHAQPHPWFKRIKTAYPHFVHGYSKNGFPIVYEQPGKMELKDLLRNGCQISDLVTHYTYFMEYLVNRVCTNEEVRTKHGNDLLPHNSSTWGIMVVMDVKNAGLSHLSGDVLLYLKRAGDTNAAHYPLSVKRAFVVNAPFWLSGVWSTIKNILPPAQVDLLSESKYLNGLREYIDDDQIPPEYGGSSPYKLGEHPFEVELDNLVEQTTETSVLPPSLSAEATPLLTDRVQNTPVKVEIELSGLSTANIPLRRRLGSADWAHPATGSGILRPSGRSEPLESQGAGGDLDLLMVVSAILVVFSAVQGAVELSLPFWALTPLALGGLGYSASRSGVVMFCSAIVLLSMLRKWPSRLLALLPTKSPMRAFRIAVGAEFILLGILAFIASERGGSDRSDSVLIMTSTIIVLASLAMFSVLGRAASKKLHSVAAHYCSRRSVSVDSRYASFQQAILSGCRSGRFSAVMFPIGEIVGMMLVSPLLSWSLSSGLPPPFDGTFALYISSSICFVLYVSSFSIHLHSATNEFTTHPRANCSCGSPIKRCLPFVGEVVSVSAGDMASLMEEANWSTTPLLGRSRTRSRVYSDTGVLTDIMERGEDASGLEIKSK